MVSIMRRMAIASKQFIRSGGADRKHCVMIVAGSVSRFRHDLFTRVKCSDVVRTCLHVHSAVRCFAHAPCGALLARDLQLTSIVKYLLGVSSRLVVA